MKIDYRGGTVRIATRNHHYRVGRTRMFTWKPYWSRGLHKGDVTFAWLFWGMAGNPMIRLTQEQWDRIITKRDERLN